MIEDVTAEGAEERREGNPGVRYQILCKPHSPPGLHHFNQMNNFEAETVSLELLYPLLLKFL